MVKHFDVPLTNSRKSIIKKISTALNIASKPYSSAIATTVANIIFI